MEEHTILVCEMLLEQSEKATERGENFLTALMGAPYEDIHESHDMKVLRNIPSLTPSSTKPSPIIVRKITKIFWEECIEQADLGFRVAVVATPGIGKTTTTPILIRMLLEMNKTVVYLVRSHESNHWYYEFIPKDDGTITTNVYPETWSRYDIDSLHLDSSYYIVDPGTTKYNCFPPTELRSRTIIVAAQNRCHLGTSVIWTIPQCVFRYYPLWTIDELLSVRTILCNNSMSTKELISIYRNVGGVPLHVFDRCNIQNQLEEQDRSLNNLDFNKARNIASGNHKGGFDLDDKPSTTSSIMGFGLATTFAKQKIVFISDRVTELALAKFMWDLWSDYKYWYVNKGGMVFTAYTRYLMQGNHKHRKFRCRSLLGDESQPEIRIQFSTTIELVQDPVQEVVDSNETFVLFYPLLQKTDGQLIDFLYRDTDGYYHVFHATVATRRGDDVRYSDIEKFARLVGDTSKIILYYLVPNYNYKVFAIDSDNLPQGIGQIYCVNIPRGRR